MNCAKYEQKYDMFGITSATVLGSAPRLGTCNFRVLHVNHVNMPPDTTIWKPLVERIVCLAEVKEVYCHA